MATGPREFMVDALSNLRYSNVEFSTLDIVRLATDFYLTQLPHVAIDFHNKRTSLDVTESVSVDEQAKTVLAALWHLLVLLAAHEVQRGRETSIIIQEIYSLVEREAEQSEKGNQRESDHRKGGPQPLSGDEREDWITTSSGYNFSTFFKPESAELPEFLQVLVHTHLRFSGARWYSIASQL